MKESNQNKSSWANNSSDDFMDTADEDFMFITPNSRKRKKSSRITDDSEDSPTSRAVKQSCVGGSSSDPDEMPEEESHNMPVTVISEERDSDSVSSDEMKLVMSEGEVEQDNKKQEKQISDGENFISLTSSSGALQAGNSELMPKSNRTSKNPSRRRKPEVCDGTCRRQLQLFVLNMRHSTTKEDIWKHFEQAGRVKNVTPFYKEETQEFRGFAYVEFCDRPSYERALSLHKTVLNNRFIKVEYAGCGRETKEYRNYKTQKLRLMQQQGLIEKLPDSVYAIPESMQKILEERRKKGWRVNNKKNKLKSKKKKKKNWREQREHYRKNKRRC